jgi:hypothetical protein
MACMWRMVMGWDVFFPPLSSRVPYRKPKTTQYVLYNLVLSPFNFQKLVVKIDLTTDRTAQRWSPPSRNGTYLLRRRLTSPSNIYQYNLLTPKSSSHAVSPNSSNYSLDQRSMFLNTNSFTTFRRLDCVVLRVSACRNNTYKVRTRYASCVCSVTLPLPPLHFSSSYPSVTVTNLL